MRDLVRRPLPVIVVALVVGIPLDLWHGYSPFPGYGALLGIVGTTVLVFGSKWLGTKLLQRPEDYYPEDLPADVDADLPPGAHADLRADAEGGGQHG
jgi:hypothetical protein